MKKIFLLIVSGIFITIITVMLLLTATNSFLGLKLYTPTNAIKNNSIVESYYINIYGGFQKLLNKQAIEDFSIFKNSYGQLVAPYREVSTEETKAKISSINGICDYCKEKGIPVLYLRSILPISDISDLPYKGIDNSHSNYNKLGELLANVEFPIIDLNDDKMLGSIKKEERFYYTDHHWSTLSAFKTFLLLANYLSSLKDLSCDRRFLNIDSYTQLTYPESFLGSYGIKVGKYYAGKDDFVVYIPKIDSDFHFEGYDSNRNIILEKDGNWFECLSDQEKLNDPNYNNKHASWTNAQSIEYSIVLASGGNRQNKFIENRQNWIIEKDQTTQFWLIS